MAQYQYHKMMRKFFIYIVILLLSCPVIEAQSTNYYKLYDTGAQDMARIFIRSCDNGFIIGGVSDVFDASWDAYIIKLDSNGNKLWNWNVGFGGASDSPVSIMETPDSNIVVFMYSTAANVKFRMAVFDYDGNLVFEKHDYYISGGFPEFVIQGALLLPDSRIVTPVVINDSILKVYWWNQTGDTLASLVLDTCRKFPGGYSGEIQHVDCFSENDTIIFCYNNYIADNAPSRVTLKTDYNGNFIEKKELYIIDVDDLSRAIRGNSNTYLFLDYSISSYCINTCLYDEINNSVITWINFLSPLYDDITDLGADFISEDTVLFCGSISNYGSMDRYAHILKIDTTSNVEWIQIYIPSGYNVSRLWSVKQYEDCIASVGEAYSYNASGPYDILFIKADLNGNATTISTFEKPDNKITVFPNPASDLINVNLLPVGESMYTIVDAGGREVLKGKTQSNQLHISSLPAGTYQLLWENDGKMYHAGFVKE
ncbi:hypothetical protein DSECCO2_464300 [anaerobic digester metagenome]